MKYTQQPPSHEQLELLNRLDTPRMTLQQYIDTQHFFEFVTADGRSDTDLRTCWYSAEQLVTRKLTQYGYTNIRWWSSDGDSFGPLVRAVRATNPQGQLEEACYG